MLDFPGQLDAGRVDLARSPECTCAGGGSLESLVGKIVGGLEKQP